MIRKRGKFFEFEFMEGGKRIRGTFNGKKGVPAVASKKDALIEEAAICKQVRAGTYGTIEKKEDSSDFGEFFDGVYMQYAKENTSDWKHAEFRGAMLKEFFINKSFSEITVMSVVRFVNARLKSTTKRGNTRNPVTVYKEVALLSAIFRMAISERDAAVADGNPCDHLPSATRKKIWPRNKRDRYLTADDEAKLFAQMVGRRSHLSQIVRFDLETGLRKSELCRLEAEHVNLATMSRFFTIQGKRIELRPGELLVTKSKNGKPRAIPLTAEARRIAEAQMADATTKKFLFTSRRTGGMISEIKTAFVGAVRDAGLEDFRFHDLRHTFSTRLNEAGADPFTVRDLLGHSTVNMAADYTHSSPEGRQRAIFAMSQSRSHVRETADADYGKITA